MTYLRSHPHITATKDWALSEEVLFMLGQCEAIIKVISEIPLTPEHRQRLLTLSLRKEARATTAIEGNTLTEEEIARIDEGESLPPSREHLEIEVKNIFEALNKIRENVILEDTTAIITPAVIKSFHYDVGKNLGDHFKATPGRFQEKNQAGGSDGASESRDFPTLIQTFCDWMNETFGSEKDKQTFADQVIQAIIFHVYLVWVHPFGDGNGRTARLIESYLLLRAEVPDIASHILSSYYNDTREEYFRQLDIVGKRRNLSDFIRYAVLGFRDGLDEILTINQRTIRDIVWEHYIFEVLDSNKATGKTKAIVRRRRNVALHFPTDKFYKVDELIENNPFLMKEYVKISSTTRKRDFQELEKLDLIVKKGSKYMGNVEILKGPMSLKKE